MERAEIIAKAKELVGCAFYACTQGKLDWGAEATINADNNGLNYLCSLVGARETEGKDVKIYDCPTALRDDRLVVGIPGSERRVEPGSEEFMGLYQGHPIFLRSVCGCEPGREEVRVDLLRFGEIVNFIISDSIGQCASWVLPEVREWASLNLEEFKGLEEWFRRPTEQRVKDMREYCRDTTVYDDTHPARHYRRRHSFPLLRVDAERYHPILSLRLEPGDTLRQLGSVYVTKHNTTPTEVTLRK